MTPIVSNADLDEWDEDFDDSGGVRALIYEVRRLRVLLHRAHSEKLGHSCICEECCEVPSGLDLQVETQHITPI